MEIKLFNTLSNKKEEFKPIKQGNVGMYHCGPTVYDYAHIGNMRAFLLADTLRRMFEFSGYKITQVMNITDVGHLVGDGDDGEDKIEEGAKREEKSVEEIISFYTEAFKNDLSDLNIPSDENSFRKFPRASKHVEEQIELIEKLENGGYTYETSDGIYFDTSKFSKYGQLGNIKIENLRAGARIEHSLQKRNTSDFALWKFSPKNKKREQEWDSPWGIGFPGWHIECSAMSMKYLGETFDIHTGGIDHVPVHHNNEIAQSQCASGKPLANYWLHNAFLTVEGKKMAKSENNILRIDDLKKRKVHPLSFRYWLLTAHYRSPANFTWDSVIGANTALERLSQSVALSLIKNKNDDFSIDQEKVDKLSEALTDDLDTPKAIALLNNLVDQIDNKNKLGTIKEFDKLLGISLFELSKSMIDSYPQEIKDLLEQRDLAREKKDWLQGDNLREKIQESGYIIIDRDGGSVVLRSLASLI